MRVSGKINSVAVVGLGYIGLPTAALFAQYYEVVGVDVDAHRVEQISKGQVRSEEPGLETLVTDSLVNGRLRVTTETPKADAYVIAVPTPIGPDKSPILDFVYDVIDAICSQLTGGELVVVESTCPPGTTARLVERIAELRPDLVQEGSGVPSQPAISVHMAYCPERILPGNALVELKTNNRIVGGSTVTSAEKARMLYRPVCNGEISITNAQTAELAKLVENSFRDVNIAFANEISMISHELGVDVWELIELANQHPRVNILKPGTGVGGHCIAVDPWFIVHSSPSSRLIETAREVNDAKPSWVVSRVDERILQEGYRTVALLGLSFKADIDDFRESPAIIVMEKLVANHQHIEFLIVEPHLDPGVNLGSRNSRRVTLEFALSHADLVVILVDHAEFKAVNWSSLSTEVLDFRGVGSAGSRT